MIHLNDMEDTETIVVADYITVENLIDILSVLDSDTEVCVGFTADGEFLSSMEPLQVSGIISAYKINGDPIVGILAETGPA